MAYPFGVHSNRYDAALEIAENIIESLKRGKGVIFKPETAHLAAIAGSNDPRADSRSDPWLSTESMTKAIFEGMEV